MIEISNIMQSKKNILLPSVIEEFGENIKLAILRRRLSSSIFRLADKRTIQIIESVKKSIQNWRGKSRKI